MPYCGGGRHVPRISLTLRPPHRYYTYLVALTCVRVVARHWDGLDDRTPRYVMRNLFYGGRLLSGHLMSLWFLPVLAFTQVLWAVVWRWLAVATPNSAAAHAAKHAALSPRRVALAIACSYMLACATSTLYRGDNRPGSRRRPAAWMAVDVVLMTFPYFAVGRLATDRWPELARANESRMPPLGAVGAAGAALTSVLVYLATSTMAAREAVALDLHISQYGMFLVTPAFTAVLIAAMAVLSQLCVVYFPPQVVDVLRFISEASITVLFWHVAILRSPLVAILEPPKVVVVIAAVGIPVAAHHLVLKRSSVTSLLLLGRRRCTQQQSQNADEQHGCERAGV